MPQPIWMNYKVPTHWWSREIESTIKYVEVLRNSEFLKKPSTEFMYYNRIMHSVVKLFYCGNKCTFILFIYRPQLATHEQFIGASSYEKYKSIILSLSGPFKTILHHVSNLPRFWKFLLISTVRWLVGEREKCFLRRAIGHTQNFWGGWL